MPARKPHPLAHQQRWEKTICPQDHLTAAAAALFELFRLHDDVHCLSALGVHAKRFEHHRCAGSGVSDQTSTGNLSEPLPKILNPKP